MRWWSVKWICFPLFIFHVRGESILFLKWSISVQIKAQSFQHGIQSLCDWFPAYCLDIFLTHLAFPHSGALFIVICTWNVHFTFSFSLPFFFLFLLKIVDIHQIIRHLPPETYTMLIVKRKEKIFLSFSNKILLFKDLWIKIEQRLS